MATTKRVNQVDSLTPLDMHIAGRLRTLRVMRGRSRQWLADFCGVSHNHIERIEMSKGRAYASRLADFAEALEVHPGYFYEGFALGSQVFGAYDPLAAEVSTNPDLAKVRLARMMTAIAALPRHMQDTLQQTLRHFTTAAEADELAAIEQAREEAGPKATSGAGAARDD